MGKTSGSLGGRPTEEFYLNRKQALFICMKAETDNAFEVQADIIRVYDAYLSGNLHRPALPNFADPVAAARAWADAQEKAQALALENQKRQEVIEVVAPKAAVFEQAFDRGEASMVNVNDFGGRLYGVNMSTIRKSLYEADILYRRGDHYYPYAQYRDSHFQSKYDDKGRSVIVANKKGMTLMVKLINQEMQ